MRRMSNPGRNARMLSSGGAIVDLNFNSAATTAGGAVGCHNSIVVNHHYGDNQDRPAKIVRWLRSPSINYRTIQEQTRCIRTPESIGWFFKLQDYLDWVEGGLEKHRHLKCIGMPGAGKTVLASAIIEDLEHRLPPSNPSSRSVLYVYFKHDRQSIQTQPIVLANLLSQIVEIQDPPSKSVQQFYNIYEKDPTVAPGQDKIMAVLKSEILANGTVYVIIDALDEFVRNDFSHGLALVRELEKLDVKLLITSRYDFGLKHKPSLKIEVSASVADLTAFIEERISCSARLGKFIEREPELKWEIITQIVAKSHGMFLITRFLTEYLCKLMTLGKVRDTLKMLPSGTDAMYELTMNRVEDQTEDLKQLAMHAISWVLMAKRRMRAKELQYVLAFELQDGDEMVDDDHLYELDDIISACAGLITCVGKEIQFVHFSTQEFFNDHSDKYFPDAELRVMETCLRYLITLAPLVPDDLRHAKDHYKKVEDYFRPFSFANYASSQWGFHALDVLDNHERLNVQLVDTFFSHSLSPYLVSDTESLGYDIQPTKEMSTIAYKTLFFASFGLNSLLKRCIDSANDQSEDFTKPDLNVRDGLGRSALFYATAHGHSTTVQLLLNEGADVTTANENNWTCLHEATECGLLNVMTMLLQHGADIDARSKCGSSAIFVAVGQNDLEAVDLLCNNGANINIRDKDCKTAFTSLIERMMESGSRTAYKKHGSTPPWDAADELEEREIAKLLLKKGADITMPSGSGQNLLHVAAGSQRYDVAAMLLENGADIESVDGDGCTPFQIAIDAHDWVAVAFFVERGAYVHLSSKVPFLSYLSGTEKAPYETIHKLVTALNDQGYDFNQRDNEGRTFLSTAAGVNRTDIIKLLLKRGADPSIADLSGDTPLHGAARCKGTGAAALLLNDPRVEIDAKNDSGKTPLLRAMDWGYPIMAEFLLEKGANPEYLSAQRFLRKNQGGYFLLQAAYRGCIRVMQLMTMAGADLDVNDGDGGGVVAYAARGHALKVLELLLSLGSVDIDKPTHYRRVTPISQAICPYETREGIPESERAAVVRILLEQGADIHLVDTNGNTPLSLARKCEWPEIRKLVEQHAIHLQSKARSEDDSDTVRADEILDNGAVGGNKMSETEAREEERVGADIGDSVQDAKPTGTSNKRRSPPSDGKAPSISESKRQRLSSVTMHP